MGINLWKFIFETAAEEEIKYVLHEARLSIPGFRPDRLSPIHRPLIIKTMIQAKKIETIRGVYQQLLDPNLNQHFKIENSLRQKIIRLVLAGDPTSIRDAEELRGQLTSSIEHKKDNLIEDSIKESSEQIIVQEWKKKYKALESEMKKKLKSLEQKYENKVKNVNELNKKIAIAEKKHKVEITKLKEEFSEVIGERNLYVKRIEEFQQTTNILEKKVQTKEEEIKEFTNLIELYKKENEIYRQKLENLLLKDNSINECIVSEKIHIRKDNEHVVNIDNKTKILVIGETIYKQENLKKFDLEFLHAQEVDAEEIEKRSDLAKIVIMLSWTMTMAMQRKIKKSIPNEKLSEFYDYSTFQNYIKEEEHTNYASN